MENSEVETIDVASLLQDLEKIPDDGDIRATGKRAVEKLREEADKIVAQEVQLYEERQVLDSALLDFHLNEVLPQLEKGFFRKLISKAPTKSPAELEADAAFGEISTRVEEIGNRRRAYDLSARKLEKALGEKPSPMRDLPWVSRFVPTKNSSSDKQLR